MEGAWEYDGRVQVWLVDGRWLSEESVWFNMAVRRRMDLQYPWVQVGTVDNTWLAEHDIQLSQITAYRRSDRSALFDCFSLACYILIVIVICESRVYLGSISLPMHVAWLLASSRAKGES